jgi:hypothetical protein
VVWLKGAGRGGADMTIELIIAGAFPSCIAVARVLVREANGLRCGQGGLLHHDPVGWMNGYNERDCHDRRRRPRPPPCLRLHGRPRISSSGLADRTRRAVRGGSGCRPRLFVSDFAAPIASRVLELRVWEADPSLDGVVALLCRLDLVIGIRFHAAIFALAQERRVIGNRLSGGERDKVAALLDDMGQNENCCSLSALSR